jgi:predicted DNA-binding transcriptional regulator AlpA
MAQTPDLRSSSEVCEAVGIDRSTLSRWIKDGTATPAMQLPGATGAYLFTPAELGRLVEWYSSRVEAKTA